MRKLLIASFLSVAVLLPGCVFVGPGNEELALDDGTVVGEMHAQSGGINGYLVTIYPEYTNAIRAYNDGPCAGDEVCTLAYLHDLDGHAEWHRATASDEAGDFRSALDDTRADAARCIAVQIKASGENWTYRTSGEDDSCTRDGSGSW